MHNASEHALAVLVDIENMARPGARNRGEFDIHLVMNRLAEKGRVVVKRAYADWSRYRDARQELMNAGLELIEMPSAREGAKNRADIKMAVDAMEIAYSRQHVDNFVIVSGDSDFTPLVGKLRELNKRVIGVGRDTSSASPLLIANCDEFFFYDSLVNKAMPRHSISGGVRPDALALLRETLMARGREGDEHPQASAVKDSMRRRDPAFDEGEIGFSTFSKFLEDAQTKGVVRLQRDPRSGTFAVELTDNAAPASDWPSVATADDRPPVEIGEGRRRRRGGRGRRSETGEGGASRTTEGAAAEAGAEVAAGDEAEVFEFEVRQRPPVAAPLPDLDQPITYEDIVLASDDLVAEAPVEAETDADGVPTRGSRRRRRSLSSVSEPTTEDLAGDEDTTSEDADTAVAATTADADTTPSTRRRVKRGTVLGTVVAPETPAAEEAEDEAPAPKRRTRAKKATEDVAAEPTTDAAAAEDDDEAAKPKRRTRTKKPVDDVAADAAEPAAETPAAEEDEAAAKPKRRPRAKKADTAEAPAATEAASPDDEDATSPKRRVRRRPTSGSDVAPETTAATGISPKVSPY
jgi:uncharacterized protein (TIGR00288 family)